MTDAPLRSKLIRYAPRMNDGTGREADPFRDQLDARWAAYLSTGRVPEDHETWITAALAYYRDEIIHCGAQLLNDSVLRPWNAKDAQSRFTEYQTEALAYDADPGAWEARYWSRVRDGAPGLYLKHDGQMP